MAEDLRQRYPELAELADGPELYAITREIESRDLAIDRWRERAEKAEAAIARVRRLAEEWAELAERGDDSAASLDRAVADSGRDLLAALDDSQDTGRG